VLACAPPPQIIGALDRGLHASSEEALQLHARRRRGARAHEGDAR
jgi:hypothetical protein